MKVSENVTRKLLKEFKNLNGKIARLESFLGSPEFYKLDTIQQKLLIVQLDAMRTYGTCLNERLTLSI